MAAWVAAWVAALGRGMGGGMDADLNNVAASGTLTSRQKTSLANVAQDEKLAHDLYVALAAKYPAQSVAPHRPGRVRHLAEVQILLKRYSLARPTSAGRGHAPPRRCRSSTTRCSPARPPGAAALAAGVTVEKTDIADITTAMC